MPLSDHYLEMKGWTPVEPAPKPLPGIPTPEVQVSPYLRTVLPLPFQYAGDTIKQYNRPGTSSFRVSPLSPSGIPTINAAVQSAVHGLIQTTTGTSEDVESIAVNKQTGTAYTVQVSDLDTLITFNNNSGGTITLPGPAAPPFGFKQVVHGSSAGVLSISITPARNSLLILQVSNTGGGGNVQPTIVDGNGNTWVYIASAVNGGNLVTNYYRAYGVNAGTDSVSITNFYGPGSGLQGQILEYSGFLQADPLDVFDIHSGTTSTIVTGASNCLVFSGMNFPGAYNPTAGTGFTSRYNDSVQLSQDQFVVTSGTSITSDSVPTAVGNGAVDFVGSFKTVSGPSSINFPPGWFTYIQNTGTGTFVITAPTTNIDGSTTNVSLPPKSGVLLVFDGTEWFTERGVTLSLPINVTGGGTGRSNLTANNVLLGEGTSPIGFAPPGVAGTVLTSNGTSFDPTFQNLPAPPTPTVGSNILLGSFTVSDSADQRGNTIFSHIRGRDMLDVAQSYNAKFVFGTGQTAGTVTATSTRIYQMNQANPSGNLFAAYTLSAAANASGGNTVYTGTNLGTLIPGSKLNIAGFGTGANNGTGFIVVASSPTTVTVNNPNGVAETHAGTAQLCVLVIGSLVSFPITTVGGAQEVTVALPNIPFNSQFDYVIAVYFKTADTSIPIILGVADTFANDGNQLRGATYTGDGTTVAVNGVLPAFTGYPTALMMHQFTVAS